MALSVRCSYFSSERFARLVGPVGITAGQRDKTPDKREKSRLELIKQFIVNAKAHAMFPALSPKSQSRFSQAMKDLNRVWLRREERPPFKEKIQEIARTVKDLVSVAT